MCLYNEAKRLFKQKDWNATRDALLRVVQIDKQNHEINQIAYEKLGDVHVKLYESMNSESNTLQTPDHTTISKYLFEGEMYYKKAIDCYHNHRQRTNRKPKFYIKYGNLLQYQLKQYGMAESMYLEYISVDKLNST
eukprot:578045_1